MSPTAKATALFMTRLRPIAFALGFAGFIRSQLAQAKSAVAKHESNLAKADECFAIL